MKIDWHSRPASDHEETIKLYLGRVRAFLDFASNQDPDVAVADKYRPMLIERVYRGPI